MKYEDLKQWINELARLNQENQELQTQLTLLNKILKKPNPVTAFSQVKSIIESISDLENINYGSIRTAADLVQNEFTPSNLFDFQSSLPKHSLKMPTDPLQTVEQKINAIYVNYEKKIKKAEKELEKYTDFEWHKLFVEHEVSTMYEGRAESFVNFTSIWNQQNKVPKPDYTVNASEMRDYTGMDPRIKQKAITRQDEITQFSMALSNQSSDYQLKFEGFKERYIKANLNSVKKESAKNALEDISRLIENTEWKTGVWGSKSKINGKEVPNHIHKIYMKAKEGLDDPARAVSAMEDINKIATEAIAYKTTFFKDQRKRDQSTENAYQEIARQTKP
ncbi:hypothetical protein [Legionella waltersii]|nr:hypothetical protein [Legionella waltersii]